MQFGFCLLKYYYSYQVNEIVCIEALHKEVCIKFGYITKIAYWYYKCNTSVLYVRVHRKAKPCIVTRAVYVRLPECSASYKVCPSLSENSLLVLEFQPQINSLIIKAISQTTLNG